MSRVPHLEDRVPGNAGRPGGRFGNLETTASSDGLEFPLSKIKQNKTKLKKDVQQVENDQTLSAPSSTSQSTKQRNGGIRLARKIKTSPVNRKRRNPVWPSSRVTSAGASTDLAVEVRGMATHKNTRCYDIRTDTEPRGTDERETAGERVG